jgi:hypothetical protein
MSVTELYSVTDARRNLRQRARESAQAGASLDRRLTL